MKYPPAIQNLIEKLSALPSVGPKTAERYVFHLLKQPAERLQDLARAISGLQAGIKRCADCLAISERNPCAICSDSSRRAGILCVVENIQDLAAIEATRQYEGRYFVLGGLIDTVNEVSPEELNFARLIERVKQAEIKELLLALNFTLEGETTALYLSKMFRGKLKVTRLAKGLPAGSDLEYADELTLGSALKFRNEISA